MESQPVLEVRHTHDGHALLRGFFDRRRDKPAQAEGHDRHDENEGAFFSDGSYGHRAICVSPRGRGACRFGRSPEKLTWFPRQIRRIGMKS